MQEVCIQAPSKVNLYLAIQGRAESGYHYISSVICPCTLADEIRIELCDSFEGVCLELELSQKLSSFLDGLDQDREYIDEALSDIASKNNLAIKAANAFLELADNGLGFSGVRIRLLKNNPIGAGLGGGSADAAAVLCALNRLSSAPLAPSKLVEMGAKLGADVPAQLAFGLVHVGGFGQLVTPLQPICSAKGSNSLEQVGVVVVVPPRMVRTPNAYRELAIALGTNSDQYGEEKAGCSAELGSLIAGIGYQAAGEENSASSVGSDNKCSDPEAAQETSISLTFGAEEVTSSMPEGEACFTGITRLLGNSFDEVVSAAYPEIDQVRKELLRLGAPRVLMTGSGSGLCCYFPTVVQAEEFAERFDSGGVSKCFVCAVRLLPDAFCWAVAKW